MGKNFGKVLKENSIIKGICENSQVNAVVVTDEDGYIVYLNQVFHLNYGYLQEDLLGLHGRVLFTLEDQKMLLPEREVESVKQKGQFTDRNYIVHKNGSCIWTNGESVLVKDMDEGSFIIKIIQNIHEQKVMEKILKESNEFSESVVSSVSDGLVVIDEDLKIAKVNKCFYEIIGIKDRTVEGLYLEDLKIEFLDSEDFRINLKDFIEGEGLKDMAFEWEVKGDVFKVLLLKAKLLNGEHTDKKVLLIISDITKDRKAQQQLELKVKERTEELNAVNNQLQLSNDELKQFAYISSHDLQEPLRKIMIFGDCLRTSVEDRLSTVEQGYLKRMINAASRMSYLIKGILNFSTIVSEEYKVNFELVDLNNVLHNIVEDLEAQIEEKQVEIQLEPLPIIPAAEVQINQLFYNLMSNSLKFSSPYRKPVIKIAESGLTIHEINEHKLEEGKEYYKIIFSDNGVGFA